MTPILILLLFTCPQVTAGNVLLTTSMLSVARLVPVTVKVDFGPAGKFSVEKQIKIRDKATPGEAVRQILPVEKGAICCHPDEVKGIDGISADPMKNRWWRLKINGSSKDVSPHKSHLKSGDIVEWIYFQDAQ